MKCRLKSIRLLAVGLALWAFPAASSIYASVSVRIVAHDGETIIATGDTVTFDVVLDVQSVEQIVGFEIYLTMDPTIFKPLFSDTATIVSGIDTTVIYRPFYPGNLIALGPALNNSHGDIWSSPYDDLNGIANFQMDYFQHTPPTPPTGPRTYFSSGGTAASFKVLVVGLPSNPSGLARINFDNQYAVPCPDDPGRSCGPRKTQFFRLGAGADPSPFVTMTPLDILVAGLVIRPEIPDTLAIPGIPLRIKLSDHFLSGLYTINQTTWGLWNETSPGGTDAFIDLSDTSLVVTSQGNDHTVVDVTVTVISTDLAYADSQAVKIIVDNPPEFNQDLSDPLLFTFDEDTQLPLTANADAGGILFTDLDDAGPNLTIWLEPDTTVYLIYDDVNTVTFSADANYFSLPASPHSARLFIRDSLGESIDTLLIFTVNSVNDTPIVYLDTLSVLGDTLVIHHGAPDSLLLSRYVEDVDDAPSSIVWSAAFLTPNPDTTNLVAGINGSWLRLSTRDNGNYDDISLQITGTDDDGAFHRDTMVVSIRSWPPILDSLGYLIVLSGPPTPLVIGLDSLVSDNDTPDSVMSWTFTAVDYYTGAPDDSVTLTWDSTGQTLTITPDSGSASVDILRYTVEDDDSNLASDSTLLGIFANLIPVLLPFPNDTVLTNSQTTLLDLDGMPLDLDDYVLDPLAPAGITWAASGYSRFQGVYIDPVTHLVTVATYASYIGNDTITFTATNSVDSSASGDMVIRIVPENNGPPVWQVLRDIEVVYPDTVDVFTLTSVAADDFTPADQLIFTAVMNPDTSKPISLLIDSTTFDVRLTTARQDTFVTWFYFIAEDDLAESDTSDTVMVNVTDYYSPVWETMPVVRFKSDQTYRDTLSKYVSDRYTPPDSLAITITWRIPSLTITYDTASTEIVITSTPVRSDSYITISATNYHGKTKSYTAHVIVELVIDRVAPDAELTYFFNPVADRWLDFVLIADSTAEDIYSDFFYQTQPRPLSFQQEDGLPGVQSWLATKEFSVEGEYKLNMRVYDGSNNELLLTLPLSIALSKTLGGSFISPDTRLLVSYPALPIPDDRLLVLRETTGLPGTEGAIQIGTNQALLRGAPPQTAYSLDTNLPEPFMVTVEYSDPALRDDYHSFYELYDGHLDPISTYALGEGRFQAEVLLGKDIVFGGSAVRAGRAPLPYEHLMLYPNPFNSTLNIRFMLRVEDTGRLRVYDLLGREIFTTPQSILSAGVNEFRWPGLTAGGRVAPSGIYFIRLETDRGTMITKKVSLLK
ncbi:MAG: T9SS type A sorting domain-containing protein [Candidatus Neomarinimicrobiota bacterium]